MNFTELARSSKDIDRQDKATTADIQNTHTEKKKRKKKLTGKAARNSVK